MKLRPTTRTLWLTIALFALGLVVSFVRDWAGVWPWVAAVWAGVLLADAAAAWQSVAPTVTRQMNKNLPVNSWSEVQLDVAHQSSTSLNLQVFDHHPVDMEVMGQPHSVSIPPQQTARLHYRIKPKRRGSDHFAGTELLQQSLLGLWQRRHWVDVPQDVRVYPNFAEVARYALMATDNRLSQLGVRRRQRRGEGQDFRQLREYRVGDPMRQIDWKATSRYKKMISREYQDERDQQVVFLVDCSRRMRHMEAGHPHLDQALNAMLLVTYIATKQGDAAGFLSFGGHEKWAKPKKGGTALNYMLDRSYDLRATMQAADYLAAAKQLLAMQRKRSLVVIMTNTRDEDQDDLLHAVQLMARKHLVVLADLQEPGLSLRTEHPVHNIDDALEYHAVYDYLQLRKQSHDQFRHAGAICLDTTAKDLPLRLVNQYLDIKQSGAL